MLTEPADLDQHTLRTTLAKRWGLQDVELEYLPVGFGSHHWRATGARGMRRFVSVDDLEATFQPGPDTDATFAALERAFRTAAALREAGLEFVLAPLPDADGVVLRRLGQRYAVRVEQFVDGEAGAFGPYESADDRRRMATLLARVHDATDRVPAHLPRRDDLAIPSRGVLEEALGDLERPWSFGPFAEDARQLLAANADRLARRLDAYDELATRVAATSESWVITHGEPHPANVIRDPHGGVHLVDWDTTLIAPRERDLRLVLDENLTEWEDYRRAADVQSLDREALRLYGEWWELADIAVFLAGFRRPHERTDDTVACWDVLARNLREPSGD